MKRVDSARARFAALVRLGARAAVVLVIGGCVAGPHAELEEARDAYRECRSKHADDASACASERQAYETAAERYERLSRQAWGCDPAQEDCPTPR